MLQNISHNYLYTTFPEGYGIVNKFVGLLITTFVISLGAPFWFDLLNRFVRIRSAGPEDGRTKKAPSQGG